MDKKDISNCIQKIPLFQKVSQDRKSIDAISSIIEIRYYQQGEYVFREQEKGDELFIILSGTVRVCKTTTYEEEYTIVDLHKDSYFGEIALMDDDVRSASIQVIEDCALIVIGRDKFEALGDKHPEITLPITKTLAKSLCEKLRNTNRDVILLYEALVNEIEESEL